MLRLKNFLINFFFKFKFKIYYLNILHRIFFFFNIRTYEFSDAVENQQIGNLWAGEFLISLSLSGEINYLDPKSNSISKVVKVCNFNIIILCYCILQIFIYLNVN